MTAPTPDETSAASVPSPPLSWLLAYRLLGLRLPAEYRPWVARDVANRAFLTWRMGRTFVWGLALIGLFYVADAAIWEPPSRRLLLRIVLVALAAALLASGKTLVRRTLRWQRIDKRGQHVAPKGLAVLDNQQALVLGAAALVAFTGASALAGFALRPTGIAAAKCGKPDAATLDRIRSGLKDSSTALQEPRQLKFDQRKLVTAMVNTPEGQPRIWLWLVEGPEIFELRTPKEKNSPTSFEPLPTSRVDRDLAPAVQRLFDCLGDRARGGGG